MINLKERVYQKKDCIVWGYNPDLRQSKSRVKSKDSLPLSKSRKLPSQQLASSAMSRKEGFLITDRCGTVVLPTSDGVRIGIAYFWRGGGGGGDRGMNGSLLDRLLNKSSWNIVSAVCGRARERCREDRLDLVDDDRNVEVEEAVCAVEGRGNDLGGGPLETFDTLRVGAKCGKDDEAVFRPSFLYMVPYIGVDANVERWGFRRASPYFASNSACTIASIFNISAGDMMCCGVNSAAGDAMPDESGSEEGSSSRDTTALGDIKWERPTSVGRLNTERKSSSVIAVDGFLDPENIRFRTTV